MLAVWRVRHREHTVRVPRQRALLLMDQTRTSAQCTQQQMIHQVKPQHAPPSHCCASHIFTVLSRDPLTMCLPSGEYATESHSPSAPSACTPAHGPNTHVSISARSSKRLGDDKVGHSPPCLSENPRPSRSVIRPADDVLAVRRVRHRGHSVRVPRQRALLLMDQTRRSEQSTQQQTIGR